MCKNKTWYGLPQEQVIDFLAPQNEISGLYHYTTMEALINGIIGTSNKKDEEICLWATHCRYLNDPEELKRGELLVGETIKELETKFASYLVAQSIDLSDLVKQYQQRCEEVYMISLSENADSLPMWSMYGNNGHGVAIELYTTIAQRDPNDIFVKCQYRDKRVMGLITDGLKKNQKLAAITISLLPFMWKNQAYEYEKEYRFVTFPNPNSVKYRCKNGIAIPYTEVRFSKELIKSIIIGPSANKELVKNALRKFLNQNNMSQVEIKQSQVPYRVM